MNGKLSVGILNEQSDFCFKVMNYNLIISFIIPIVHCLFQLLLIYNFVSIILEFVIKCNFTTNFLHEKYTNTKNLCPLNSSLTRTKQQNSNYCNHQHI